MVVHMVLFHRLQKCLRSKVFYQQHPSKTFESVASDLGEILSAFDKGNGSRAELRTVKYHPKGEVR